MKQGILALAAGALLPLAFAPFDLWPLALVSVALWFHLLDRDPGRGLLLGWLYGVGKYAVGVSWVYVSIHEYGNAPPVLAGLLVALFVAGLALFTTANAWLFVWVRNRSPGADGNAPASASAAATDWTSAAWFVVLFVGFDWLLTWFLTGFPWLLLGYAFLETPLSGFAPVGGVLLVSLAAAIVAVALALIAPLLSGGPLLRRGLLLSAAFRRPAAVLLLLVLLPWLIGLGLGQVPWTTAEQARTVALVQGNVAQTVKWQPETRIPIIERYLDLTEPHWGVDLILWPEAALTVFAHEAPELLERLDERGRRSGSGLILGIPGLEVRPGEEVVFHNTTIGLGMASGRYVKRRLVPFGEYVPFENLLRGLIGFFDLPMSHAEAGDWRQPLLSIQGRPAVMSICYEVVYPELMRADADVLLTVSNDTWFGDSIGPRQHLQMARMRALENGRWLLRSTNDGITAIVDPQGTVTAHLPRFTPGVLRGQYHSMSGRTLFNRLGDGPLLLLLALTAGLLFFMERGRRGVRVSRASASNDSE